MQRITNFSSQKLSDYTNLIDSTQIKNIVSSAKTLKGKKIYEINSTAAGGGVAELLNSQLPLYKDLGLDVDWLVLEPNDEFFNITKTLHNCLQGMCSPPDNADLNNYSKYLSQIVKDIPLDGDLYILHDPQTLGLAPFLKEKKLVWRCHIDLTQADSNILSWVTKFYKYFDRIIFSLQQYAKDVDNQKVAIVQPSIDPLSNKNRPVSDQLITRILKQNSIDGNLPYLLQVSRFDKFKDPLGVIDIFHQVLKYLPDTQLVLVGGSATDDPEGKVYYQKVLTKTKTVDSSRIKIINNIDDVSVNALQRAASVVLQNSIKEGFGLTVTEALWKKKIVLSRPVGGITVQIIDGKTGYYLSKTNKESAMQIVDILKNIGNYSDIGNNAKSLVRSKFITPIMLADYLKLYLDVINNNQSKIS